MEFTLLGTGASDGWPNAWCGCASCADQRTRTPRTPTCAAVDRRLLLDAGPEMPRQALRAGLNLADIEVVAITHAHDDHCHPSFLMHRSWVTDRPLTVVGTSPVIDACRPWLAPDQTVVDFVQVSAGDELEVAGFRLRAIPANHYAHGEAVLWAVDDGSAALLYATDTGPWPKPARAALAGWRFDLVALEETFGHGPRKVPQHHNLETFAAALADLRAWGNTDEATRQVAIHLGHDNPPLPELTAALAAIGAEAHDDLTTLTVARNP